MVYTLPNDAENASMLKFKPRTLPLEALEIRVCPVGTCREEAKRMEAGSETRIWHGSAKDDD